MKNKVSVFARVPAILLMVLMLAVVLAACVDTNDGVDIIDNMSLDLSQQESAEEVSVDDISTPDGYTAAPTVKQIINISPSTVAVCGECEENASITVSGGKEDAHTTANGTYFVVNVDLKYEAANLLEVTAKVDGKEASLARSVIAEYNATADTRLDGNSVSVGTNSRLYFDKMLDDASGTNLYTVSQLKKIRAKVTETIGGYETRAQGDAVELIYVLVPNVTTVYPDIFPEGAVKDTNTTLYQQIKETLSQTRATVVDMLPIFEQLKEDPTVLEKGGLYRVTDSNLTDYAAFLTYTEVMNVVAQRFPDAAPRAEEEFEFKKVSTLGGNLVNYREIDPTLITEEITIMTAGAGIDLNLGSNETGSTKLNSIRKYKDAANGDYGFFTTADNNDNINGCTERWLVRTNRKDTLSLPNALIYRDDCTLPFMDFILERFETTMIAKSGDFDINLSNAIQYSAEDKKVVDYIIVFLSEENMDNAFTLALNEN